ncbi:MAG TPA: regulatory protein RecX [Bryobacteraceae bacterium]|nr:regulatory protein RecX [Bryobacteraceae bacterium]
MKRAPKLLDLEELMNYAAHALASRAQSLNELRNRLKRRAARQEDVAEVLSRLKQGGYLNDARFADAFANWRRDNRGLGKARVMRDLMARRVAPAVARKAVDAAYAEVDELSLIESFLERKYREKNLSALLSEEKQLASAYRKLRGAGFTAGNSIRILKRYAARADDLEALEDQTDTAQPPGE